MKRKFGGVEHFIRGVRDILGGLPPPPPPVNPPMISSCVISFLTDNFNSESSSEENNELFLSVSKDLDRNSHSGGSVDSLDSDAVSFKY